MTVIVLCDFCYESINGEDRHHIEIRADEYRNIADLDLCAQCLKKLTDFIIDKKCEGASI